MRAFSSLAFLLCASPLTAQVAVLHTEINPANGHTYMLLDESNWSDAEAEAVNLGGHLVTINDLAENTWVFNTFGNWNGVPRDLWMGFNDEVLEASFEWTSGQAVTYTNWAINQPDNNTGTDPNGEQYVHMYGFGSIYGPGQWNDVFDANPGSAPWSFGYYGVVEVEGPSLTLTGTCPGPVTFDLTGASPFAPVAVITGTNPGAFAIPAGFTCAGTVIGVTNPTVRTFVAADVNGDVSLSLTLPPGACGVLAVQMIDFTACSASNLLAL